MMIGQNRVMGLGIWWWMTLVLVGIHINESGGCWEQERVGLLQLKASINYPNGNSLPSWVDTKTSNCCDWFEVTCNPNTGRVNMLDLAYTRFLGDWYLNASVLLPFEELQSLDLSLNSLVGLAETEGLQKLSSRLSKLERFYLGFNRLNNSILSSLSIFSSLKFLDLSYNNLEGPVVISEALNNLEHLSLEGNAIDNFITTKGVKNSSKLKSLILNDIEFKDTSILFRSLLAFSSLEVLTLGHFLEVRPSIQEANTTELRHLSHLEELHLHGFSFNNNFLQDIGNLTSLKVLSLQDCKLNDALSTNELRHLGHLEEVFLDGSSPEKKFLQDIGMMTSLKVLSMRDCGFNGTLPITVWCDLKNLQELDLSENEFKGTLPSCMGNLTSLRLLDLSRNQLAGNIASSSLVSLTSLEYLAFSDNQFHVPTSFKSFANHSNLKVILSDANEMIVENEFQTWAPRFQLKVFSLSYSKLNFTPSLLYHQYDLRVVDLSHNKLKGNSWSWLLENNTQLEILDFRKNLFTGPFKLPLHPNPKISFIDISQNNIQDHIPTNIGLIFPNLVELNMSNNGLEGSIPSSFGDMKSLRTLDLSNNNLIGRIPEHFAAGCSNLFFLKLANNSLQGQIFPTAINFPNLAALHLGGNKFVGVIPDSLSNISLATLDVRDNQLSGKLPRWLGNMALFEIDMSKNLFEGPIPEEFCNITSLEFLDLSENHLSGPIPSCFNLPEIKRVHLSKNSFRGGITGAFCNSSSLVTLDLSNNYLSGSIPNCIGDLPALSIILLKANLFEGMIPNGMCNLSKLGILDLSHNDLSGSIPACLGNLTSEKTNEKTREGEPHFLSVFHSQKSSEMNLKNITIAKTVNVFNDAPDYPMMDVVPQVEFTTKKRADSYKGNILNLMSGIDLSCNQLTGEIPNQLGNLSEIRGLNLSYNNLTGSIPTTFSNLRNIESLDLSYNKLSGAIPPQLTELNSLAVFSVAHNNLSGTIPDRKAQFATFEENSYEGNPLLCGPPLHNDCSQNGSSSPSTNVSNSERDDDSFIDMGVFRMSFAASYITALLGVYAVLLINPHWRQAWFRLFESYMASCYYIVRDNFRKLCNYI